MKLLYKDQFKKIKNNLFYFISLSLLLFIVSLSFTSVKTSVNRLEENYDTYLEEQNIEDFYFFMGKIDVNYLGATAIIELCLELGIGVECGFALQEPIDPIKINNLNVLLNEKIKEKPELYEGIIDGYVTEFTDRYDYTVEKERLANVNVGEYYYKFLTVTNTINIPYIIEGELPLNDNEIAIFPEFAEANDISINDTYIIDGKTYLVTGFFYSPDFLLPLFSMSTISFDETVQTLVLCNENTIFDLNDNVFTKFIVKGDLGLIYEDFGYDTILNTDLSLLGKNMQMVTIILPKEINFRITSLETEVDNANAFIDVFLSLFVFLVLILLLIFMKKYIDKNKNDISILKALGYSNTEISRSLLVFPLLVTSFIIFGYIGGLLFSDYLFDAYSARYLFPKALFTFDLNIFILSVLIPFILILLANYIFIYQAVSDKKRIKYRKHLRVFRFTPFKTVLTTFVLFLTISVMIIFGLSSKSMFTDFVDETKLGNNFSEMVNLQYMSNDLLDPNYESFTKASSKIIKINDIDLNESYNTVVYGIDPSNNLKLLIENDVDNNQLLNEGIVISDYLHTLLSLNIGDEITFLIGNKETTENIVGISNELIENNIFINKETLNSYFGLDNTYYNGVYVTDNLYNNEYVNTRIDYQNSLDEFASLLNISSLIMGFLVILSIILSLYIFSLILITYFNDNKTDIAILKTIGFNNYEINLKYLLIVYIILVLSFIISIPITQELLDTLLLMLMNNIGFKLVLNIKLLSILIGFTVLNLIFFMTVLLTGLYYDKISITDLIDIRIK